MDSLLRASSLSEFERKFVRPNAGRTLIVGSKIYQGKEDRRQRYADAVGIDMLEGDGVDIVLDLEEELPSSIGKFAHVECMSVLEHSRRPWLMAENIQKLMLPDATIFLSVPFIWRIHAYPSDYFRITPAGISSLFTGIDWRHLMLAADDLRTGPSVHSTTIAGHPYMARTESVGFGVRL
jgi:hypothetical protein